LGRLAAITADDKSATVNFPTHPGWNGLLAELELVEEAECTRDFLTCDAMFTLLSAPRSGGVYF
jgi:hypothetical protein